MKKLITKSFYTLSAVILFGAIASKVRAQQFSRVNLEKGGSYTALAKDTSNNIYVMRTRPGTQGAIYFIEKYTNGAGSPASIYGGLTHELGDYPWGLAVDSHGNIYVSTDFTLNKGRITKLTKNGGTYTASTFQLGRYFSALFFDKFDNLFAAEYDAKNKTYAVVKYPTGSAAFKPGITLYDNLKSAAGYTYPTGLTVAPSGDVYVADAFSNTPTINDGGHVYKLSKASGYTASIISTGQYATSLAIGPGGNLFSSENSGTGYQIVEYPQGGGNSFPVFSPMHSNGVYYPWGIAVINSDKIFAVDGDDGINGSAVMGLTSSNTGLANLITNSGILTPVFASSTTTYTVSVSNATPSIKVTPVFGDAGQTIAVNGAAVSSGSASASIPLLVGINNIAVVVTAPDGITKKTYTLKVSRAASTNANLAFMNRSAGTMTPAFSSSVTSYAENVVNTVSSITITAKTSDANATMKINGTTVVSNTASAPIALAVGANVITTVVTAQDGVTTKTYTLTVTRGASTVASLSSLKFSGGVTLTPAFATATTSYTTSVPATTASITVTPTTTDANATVKVNGAVVTSGTASAAIPLAIGSNVITTVVTAQNGTSTKTYKVTITKTASTNANLAFLNRSAGAMTPTFSSSVTSYSENVSNALTSITITAKTSDANATMKINGTTVVSNTASPPIALSIGANVIITVVTAQDGTTTKTYTLTVTRANGPIGVINNPGLTLSDVETPADALESDNILVHQGVTPNGDGVNDALIIDGITKYPDNKLMIMSRSGTLVFEAKGYDNATKTFDGHSNKTGARQLPGTYFYSLDYTVNGVSKHKTGYIVLKY